MPINIHENICENNIHKKAVYFVSIFNIISNAYSNVLS